MATPDEDSPQIFVQIAAYRDPELLPTIDRLLSTAANPDAFFSFGICWQYGPEEEDILSKFDERPNFRVHKVPHGESRGLGWARSVTNGLHRGEPYTLQLDSHHVFVQGWDAMLLEDYSQAKTFSDKPVLTTYTPPYNVGVAVPDRPVPTLMSQYEFSADRLLMSRPWYIPKEVTDQKRVIRARTISAHFLFADSRFLEEVPYDPEAFFGGYVEEATLSSRAWTHGWDFFSPYRCYIFHEYTRAGRPKIWEDNPSETSRWDMNARSRARQLHGQEQAGKDLGRYGLGSVRTFREYEEFAGLDFEQCRIHRHTLDVREPPNPKPWEDGFTAKSFEATAAWNADMIREDCSSHAGDENEFRLKCLTLGFETSTGRTMHRADMRMDNEPDVFSYERVTKTVAFQNSSGENPVKWVLWPLFVNAKTGEDKWGRRQEGLSTWRVIDHLHSGKCILGHR